MWHWMKRWRDWATHDLWTSPRPGSQTQALRYNYAFEKAGLTLHDQPVPWNAEAVLVEILVRLPNTFPRRKTDFHLRIPDQDPIPAESLSPEEEENQVLLRFRLLPPSQTVLPELIYRNQRLGQMKLPVLSREEFLRHLRLELPTFLVRLENQYVACQTFVSSQCRGLMATALLNSPTSLAPLLDLGLQVEFHSERRGLVETAPVRLASSQLAGRQALVAVVPRHYPRRIGAWNVAWMIGDRPLSNQRLRAVSLRRLHQSLSVSGTRFVVRTTNDEVKLSRIIPSLEEVSRLGPGFLVNSEEPGMAGFCSLQVRVHVGGGAPLPDLPVQEVLITDGPTLVAPGTLDVRDLEQASAFELFVKGRSLGLLPLSSVPIASFTSEGGFKAPPDFVWSANADEELNDRLSRLLEGRDREEDQFDT